MNVQIYFLDGIEYILCTRSSPFPLIFNGKMIIGRLLQNEIFVLFSTYPLYKRLLLDNP